MHNDNQVPILCDSVVEDPLLPNHYLLKGVRGLKDNAYPDIEIHSMSTKKSDINYYVMGDESTSPEMIDPGEVITPKEENKNFNKERKKAGKKRKTKM